MGRIVAEAVIACSRGFLDLVRDFAERLLESEAFDGRSQLLGIEDVRSTGPQIFKGLSSESRESRRAKAKGLLPFLLGLEFGEDQGREGVLLLGRKLGSLFECLLE
jgi:hypothetical protein